MLNSYEPLNTVNPQTHPTSIHRLTLSMPISDFVTQLPCYYDTSKTYKKDIDVDGAPNNPDKVLITFEIAQSPDNAYLETGSEYTGALPIKDVKNIHLAIHASSIPSTLPIDAWHLHMDVAEKFPMQSLNHSYHYLQSVAAKCMKANEIYKQITGDVGLPSSLSSIEKTFCQLLDRRLHPPRHQSLLPRVFNNPHPLHPQIHEFAGISECGPEGMDLPMRAIRGTLKNLIPYLSVSSIMVTEDFLFAIHNNKAAIKTMKHEYDETPIVNIITTALDIAKQKTPEAENAIEMAESQLINVIADAKAEMASVSEIVLRYLVAQSFRVSSEDPEIATISLMERFYRNFDKVCSIAPYDSEATKQFAVYLTALEPERAKEELSAALKAGGVPYVLPELMQVAETIEECLDTVGAGDIGDSNEEIE